MNELKNRVKDCIEGRRTISFGNICGNFDISSSRLYPIIESLESDKKIRVVNSACTLDCNSCSSCGDQPTGRYHETTIIVSLKI